MTASTKSAGIYLIRVLQYQSERFTDEGQDVQALSSPSEEGEDFSEDVFLEPSAGQNGVSQYRAGQYRIGQYRIGQNGVGQYRSAQIGAGQVGSR